ncbi:MAG: hypothetical protein EBW19_03625 [Betaproteobacteria bacterium]|nr:hypothetical protein [Betaproteobacteria bacterium]
MAIWSDFHSDVAHHVPGCPNPLLDQALCRSAAAFFRRAKVWTVWLEPITMAGSLQTYELEPPEDTDIVTIQKATLNGHELPVAAFRLLGKNPETQSQTMRERALISTDRSTVSVLLAQPAKTKLEIQVVITVSQDAKGLPDLHATFYREPIVTGALHRLLRVPGPFYNAQAAKEALQAYEEALAREQTQSFQGPLGQMPRAAVGWC